MEVSVRSLYLSLGSNLGDRHEYILEAIGEIEEKIGESLEISEFYETEAWGFKSDSAFLNVCIHVKSQLAPHSVLSMLKLIESDLGRIKTTVPGYTSRIIDIDIILYGNIITSDDQLQIPHPHFAARRFVLQPLNDIAANLVDPNTYLTVGQLLANCSDTSQISLYLKEM